MVRRHWIAAPLLICAGLGCHASPQPKIARTEPPVVTRSDVLATQFIAQHNKNAAAITSLESSPSVVVIEGGDRKGQLNGHLALDQNKNFRLELEKLRKSYADIGSNEDGFWFWVDADKERSIYVCDYKDIDSCPLAVTLQPDWIIEAMGLRPFSAAEARTLHAKTGDTPGTFVITQSRRDSKGQTYTKETIVNEQNKAILEHRLYAGAKTDLLAVAKVTKYLKNEIAAGPVETSQGLDENGETSPPAKIVVLIPSEIRLNWVKENFALDIYMSKVIVNPTFPGKRRAVLFTEPTIAGVTKKNLALLDTATEPASGSRIRETRPIPPAGGIQLQSPQPALTYPRSTTRRAIDPLPLSADLTATPAQPAGVIGAQVPTAPSNLARREAPVSSWRSPTLE